MEKLERSLALLIVKNPLYWNKFRQQHIDEYFNLEDIDFNKLCSSGLNLQKTIFNNANFNQSRFREIDFTRAIIKDTTFRQATIAKSDFTEADISNVNFSLLEECRYYGGNYGRFRQFPGAGCLNWCIFHKTILDNVDMSYRDISWSSFDNAILNNVNFKETNFHCNSFRNAILNKITFYNANFGPSIDMKNVIVNNITWGTEYPGYYYGYLLRSGDPSIFQYIKGYFYIMMNKHFIQERRNQYKSSEPVRDMISIQQEFSKFLEIEQKIKKIPENKDFSNIAWLKKNRSFYQIDHKTELEDSDGFYILYQDDPDRAWKWRRNDSIKERREREKKERLLNEIPNIKNSLKQLITRVDLVERRITDIEHKNS